VPRREIALATRELYPFMGGGIAPIVAATARVLSTVARITIFTTASHEAAYRELSREQPLYGPGVDVVFVEEPDPLGFGHFSSYMHAWSGRLFEAIGDHYEAGGPDLIEFPDYLGEGFVTVQARRAGEPFLRATKVIVRTHTTAEMTSILNGALREDFETRAVFEIERFTLRHADHVIHPGGDVLGTYRRFYRDEPFAAARRVTEAFHTEFSPADPEPPSPGTVEQPLRLLFLGRLERRKGAYDLVRALVRVGYRNWRLTFLGADTDSAPLASSMRDSMRLAIDDDDRFAFAEPVERREVGAVIAAHDLVVMPSRWECWPNVAREAFLHNRPVLGTPVGGIVEMVEHGVSGWLAADPSMDALIAALERLFEHPGEVAELIAAGGPRAAFDRLVDPERTRRDYLDLIDEPGPRPARPAVGRASVSVVIPYFHMHEHVGETVESVLAQTRPPEEVVIVDDGSFAPPDALMHDLAERHGLRVVGQPNSGLGAARNLGIAVARGRYVLPLDPDNALEPEFVERTLALLEADDSLAYATSWSRYMDEEGRLVGDRPEGYAPLGNWSRLVDDNNVAGDGTALIRRRLFDLGYRYDTGLTSYEDWFLYRQFHHGGHHGAVIPRRLFRYRIRTESMLRVTGLRHTGRIADEMRALLIEREVEWTPPNG
jgi:glycogen(starch) synthase